MSATDDIRYASTEKVIRTATDMDPAEADEILQTRAKARAKAATQKWINRTGQPFHPVRVGNIDDPRTWEVYDVEKAVSWWPAVVILDNDSPLPLDPSQGDTIEVREGRDTWEDITDEEGDSWVLDYQQRRLQIYHRNLAFGPYDDPDRRFVRLTYRHGPLGDDVQITDDGLVESVPADVTEAVAAKAATKLALDDDARASIPDDGQLTARTTKRDALEAIWEDTTAEYSGFSTV
jgi:hypothetical protein